jgi:hypothetical protein
LAAEVLFVELTEVHAGLLWHAREHSRGVGAKQCERDSTLANQRESNCVRFWLPPRSAALIGHVNDNHLVETEHHEECSTWEFGPGVGRFDEHPSTTN